MVSCRKYEKVSILNSSHNEEKLFDYKSIKDVIGKSYKTFWIVFIDAELILQVEIVDASKLHYLRYLGTGCDFSQ